MDQARDILASATEALRNGLPEPHASAARVNIATALSHLGRRNEARTAYQDVLRARPSHASALFNLGVLAAQDNLNEEAIALYDRALSVAPASPASYNNLAAVLLRQPRQPGASKHAATAYRAATQLRPAYFDAYANLATLLSEGGGGGDDDSDGDGRLRAAVRALRLCVALRPADSGSALRLEAALRRLNQPPDEDRGRYARAASVARLLGSLTAHNGIDAPALRRATATFGLPAGWHVYTTAPGASSGEHSGPAFRFRYEGDAATPPPLWALSDAATGQHVEAFSGQVAVDPLPPPLPPPQPAAGALAKDAAALPRIHYAVLTLRTNEARLANVKALAADHPYVEVLTAFDGEREWHAVLDEAARLQLRFKRWRTWRGYVARLVSYAHYLTWLHAKRRDFEYGVLLEDDVALPSDFRRRVEQLALANASSRRLGRCASADLLRVADVPQMLAQLGARPIDCNDDLFFGAGPDAMLHGRPGLNTRGPGLPAPHADPAREAPATCIHATTPALPHAGHSRATLTGGRARRSQWPTCCPRVPSSTRWSSRARAATQGTTAVSSKAAAAPPSPWMATSSRSARRCRFTVGWPAHVGGGVPGTVLWVGVACAWPGPGGEIQFCQQHVRVVALLSTTNLLRRAVRGRWAPRTAPGA